MWQVKTKICFRQIKFCKFIVKLLSLNKMAAIWRLRAVYFETLSFLLDRTFSDWGTVFYFTRPLVQNQLSPGFSNILGLSLGLWRKLFEKLYFLFSISKYLDLTISWLSWHQLVMFIANSNITVPKVCGECQRNK